MSKCPHCGRQNVRAPEGYEAVCGRRVHSNELPSGSWKERMWVTRACTLARHIPDPPKGVELNDHHLKVLFKAANYVFNNVSAAAFGSQDDNENLEAALIILDRRVGTEPPPPAK